MCPKLSDIGPLKVPSLRHNKPQSSALEYTPSSSSSYAQLSSNKESKEASQSLVYYADRGCLGSQKTSDKKLHLATRLTDSLIPFHHQTTPGFEII